MARAGRMKKRVLGTSVLVLIIALSARFGFTVVPIEQVTEQRLAEAFDAATFVDEMWESRILPAIDEAAVDLSLVLNEWAVGSDGFAVTDDLIETAQRYGVITTGQAHIYLVTATGTVTAVNTETSLGTITVDIDGYQGPVSVVLFAGPRIPSDDSSIRDGVQFIQFGDFRDQTEYGRVAGEINRRVVRDVLEPISAPDLLGQRIRFTGSFTVRTFNLVRIDLNQIRVIATRLSVESDG
ncbi:MAG: DUF2291 family protein [Spirochaetaceae bacterium]|nr:MAG: DUF2291 family protein [Spirochaetaceae bacterium]